MDDAPDDGFARNYAVELLCEMRPTLDAAGVLRAIRRHCPSAEPLDPTGEGGALVFSHSEHTPRYSENGMPAQTLVSASDEPFDLSDVPDDTFRQSWQFSDVRTAVARCRSRVLVTDVMA